MALGKGMKIGLIGAAALAAIVVIGLVTLYSKLDAIAKSAIERSMTYVLQVDVTLQGVEISPTQGEVKLTGLVVENPEGYETENALRFDEVNVAVDLASFRTDQPIIRRIAVTSPKITLEQGLRQSNLGKLVENASRLEAGGETATEPESAPEEAQKKVRIDQLTIEQGTVALSAPVLKGREASFTLPTIEMENLGGESEHVSIAQAIRTVLLEIMKQASAAGGALMPDQLQAQLGETVSGLTEGVGQAAESLKEQTGEAGEQLKESLKGAGEGLEGATDSLKGLFGKSEEK